MLQKGLCHQFVVAPFDGEVQLFLKCFSHLPGNCHGAVSLKLRKTFFHHGGDVAQQAGICLQTRTNAGALHFNHDFTQ